MTELVLVGDGPERDLIQQTVDELELTASVHFAGRLDEAATLRAIAQSDVLVLPSFMEGLPVVLMEAMALGVPVVAARVAGIPELVSNEEEGLLFNPSDWDDLAAKVEWLVRTPNAATRISRAAHKRVSAEFAIEQAVKPLLDCFDRT
jgi:glycosyltransferase involved in cell wall biosynthesis